MIITITGAMKLHTNLVSYLSQQLQKKKEIEQHGHWCGCVGLYDVSLRLRVAITSPLLTPQQETQRNGQDHVQQRETYIT